VLSYLSLLGVKSGFQVSLKIKKVWSWLAAVVLG
jgi:hypothetical protein